MYQTRDKSTHATISIQVIKSLARDPKRAKGINRALATFIAADMGPLSIVVYDAEFQDMLQPLEPLYKIPSQIHRFYGFSFHMALSLFHMVSCVRYSHTRYISFNLKTVLVGTFDKLQVR